ncbi:MAG: hypothetical protein HYX84_03510 [Chloroflexi bacterium]|nr:hypothetical protein [Chloroflexota bacterium]
MTEQHKAKMSRDKVMLAQHVLEVRHEPSGSFLDVRGYVADYIRNAGHFPHWKIDPNIVTFRDMPDRVKQDGAHASYKSAGYMVYNAATRNYFVDKASSFWKVLLKNEHYKIPKAIRFGCRTLVFVPTDMSFDEINKLTFRTLFTDKVQSFVNDKETDLRFVIEFYQDQFQVRMSGGPLHENEAPKYMSFESDYFKKCGLFLDIDYYKTKDLDHSTITKLLHDAVELSWLKIETIANSLGL